MVMSWIWVGILAISVIASMVLGNGAGLAVAVPKGAQAGLELGGVGYLFPPHLLNPVRIFFNKPCCIWARYPMDLNASCGRYKPKHVISKNWVAAFCKVLQKICVSINQNALAVF